MVSYTGYWTFFCAPKTWAIDGFLATNNEYNTYRVNKTYKDLVKPGQIAVIRVGIDNRNKEELGGKKKLTSPLRFIYNAAAVKVRFLGYL